MRLPWITCWLRLIKISGQYSIYYVRHLGIAFENGFAKLEGSKSC